jgi:cyanophycinase
VLVVDLTNSTRVNARPLHVRGAELTWLDHGDHLDIATAQLQISTAKQAGKRLDASQSDFKPYYRSVRFYPDFLGDATLLNAMTELVDSTANETRGLAFSPPATSAGNRRARPNEADTNLGFEFRLFKKEKTHGFYASALGGEDYTVVQMGLDIVPVNMATPLYQPAPENNRDRKAEGAKAGENGDSTKSASPTLEKSQ